MFIKLCDHLTLDFFITCSPLLLTQRRKLIVLSRMPNNALHQCNARGGRVTPYHGNGIRGCSAYLGTVFITFSNNTVLLWVIFTEFGIALGYKFTEFGIVLGYKFTEFGIALGYKFTEFGIALGYIYRVWYCFGL